MSDTDQDQPTTTPWWIRMALLAAVAIFVVSGFVIYYQFWTTPDTDCGIAVTATNSLTKATVVVERVTSDPSGELRYSEVIQERNGYEARFFLTSGTYKVTVFGADGRLLHSEPAEFIPPGRRLLLDLRRRFPSSRPTTAAM